MAEKNTIKVMIDGKSFSIGGYESTEYLEHVAFYINNKINEMKELPGYSRQSPEMRSILLALNVADDYYKAKTRADALEEDIESKDGEWYSVKQDLVNAQVRIHELERKLAERSGNVPDPKDPGETGEPVHAGAQETEEGSGTYDRKEQDPDDGSAAQETAGPVKTQKAANDKYLKRSRRYVKNRS